MNVGGRIVTDAFKRLFERSEPDHAPRAGDIGHEVDFEAVGHDIPQRQEWERKMRM